jgi:superfamily II DNA/RNA helicase
MSFKKLRPELAELLTEKGLTELNSFQESILDSLKAGKNILAEGPDGSGKSFSVFISLLQKIVEPGEGSPRAIVVCADDDRARSLHQQLESYCRIMDLTVDLAHEKGNMLQQRNDIFDGTEIIVGTPKRLYDLYIQNGYNVSKMKLFVIDDALEIFRKGHKMHLSRIAGSLPKCQYVLLSHSFSDKRVEEYLDEYVPVHQVIEAE